MRGTNQEYYLINFKGSAKTDLCHMHVHFYIYTNYILRKGRFKKIHDKPYLLVLEPDRGQTPKENVGKQISLGNSDIQRKRNLIRENR